MLKNDYEATFITKLIRAVILALFCSLLSAFFISTVHAGNVVANEILFPGTQTNEYTITNISGHQHATASSVILILK